MGRAGREAKLGNRPAPERNLLGDVAVPGIVGLQHNSSRETIKTYAITRTLIQMRRAAGGMELAAYQNRPTKSAHERVSGVHVSEAPGSPELSGTLSAAD